MYINLLYIHMLLFQTINLKTLIKCGFENLLLCLVNTFSCNNKSIKFEFGRLIYSAYELNIKLIFLIGYF